MLELFINWRIRILVIIIIIIIVINRCEKLLIICMLCVLNILYYKIFFIGINKFLSIFPVLKLFRLGMVI